MAKISAKSGCRFSKRLKNSFLSSSPVEISYSSSKDFHESSSCLVKKPSLSCPKKEKFDSSISFDMEDIVIYLKQLEDSHCSSLGAAVGDPHKCNESIAILISDVANLKKQLTHIQHEGVKSFNKVLRQVDSAAARAEISDNELAIVVQNSYSSLSIRFKKSYHLFSKRIINMLKYFLGRA
ncbi:hypothetical protein HAX54_001765 [Datura stramonium]|uniref:Uncharacterized protein n=1 Tax=Datura stramonium TaxID=4076 RepID=A0ABS8T3I8_DATST|nr:hypothetical protein [Datura stramonium]